MTNDWGNAFRKPFSATRVSAVPGLTGVRGRSVIRTVEADRPSEPESARGMEVCGGTNNMILKTVFFLLLTRTGS